MSNIFSPLTGFARHKQTLREEIERHMKEFLERGGEVEQCGHGERACQPLSTPKGRKPRV